MSTTTKAIAADKPLTTSQQQTISAAVEDAMNTFDGFAGLRDKSIGDILIEFADMMENDLLEHSEAEIQDEFKNNGHHVRYMRDVDALMGTDCIKRFAEDWWSGTKSTKANGADSREREHINELREIAIEAAKLLEYIRKSDLATRCLPIEPLVEALGKIGYRKSDKTS